MKELLIFIQILIFSTFVFVAIIAFEKWHKYSQEKRLRDLVSWHFTGGDGIALWAEISNAQIRLQLPQKYLVSGDEEWNLVKEILQEYRKDLVHSYFQGCLRLPKSKCVIRGEVYFMFALYAFLSEHQCDYEFLGHNMHKERVHYKSYGSAISAGYEATYSLSDFAIVFHKMHYITYMYSRGNEMLREFVPERNEKNLKEILDTNQIHLSRF